MPQHPVHLLGAGPVGCLAAILLAQRGFKAIIHERRPDSRRQGAYGGRSINLALSNRGFLALAAARLEAEIQSVGLPMPGRLIHDRQGQVQFQAYGKEGQAIYSLSRAGLNYKLMDLAQLQGVQIHFESRCVDVLLAQHELVLEHQGEIHHEPYHVLLGTDGSYSALRYAMQKTDRFDYSQSYLPHGYKELHIPPTQGGEFAMNPDGLHIWPRGQYMMIALPNPDRSFTCTLFQPYEADPERGVQEGLQDLQSDEEILRFFKRDFKDAVPLMPTLLEDFRKNATSSLVTVRCSPWNYGPSCIMGDAAHAIVPFYGQGLNCGLEDVRKLMELVDAVGLHPESDQQAWANVLETFATTRKPDGDAIAQLALDNFIEMRDKVADPRFVFQKNLEARMQEQFAGQWTPLYTQVTFEPLTPYHQAYRNGQVQQALMDRIIDRIYSSLSEQDHGNMNLIDPIIQQELHAIGQA
ncbi:MAG: FAD-dependent monooxygenase [Sphingomonadales bacterium]|nr:FAD-dependent monooxygenase [Sphingomonadales bacterium]